MTASYRLTREAQTDLIEIRRFTRERWGGEQSQHHIEGLRDTLRSLSAMPTMGAVKPDIAEDLYRFPYSGHMIYYCITDRQLIVLAILHQSMLPENHLHDRSSGDMD